jgi:hypothetical protein
MSEEWTIATLKALFEERLSSLSAKHDADFRLLKADADNRAAALIMQAAEYERRLDALNHEAARINAANAQNVSREVYDADRRGDIDWRRRVEGIATTAVAREEFQTYKDSTSTTLTRQEGKREGTGGIFQMVYMGVIGLAAIVAMIATTSTFFAGPRALPVANPVTYQQAVGQPVIVPAVPK